MKQKIFFLFFIIFISVGCKNSAKQNAANGEGMITYKITYPDNNPYKNVKMLPGETNLVVKGVKASFITSAMGMIQIVNLLDNDKKKFTSLLLNSIGENYALCENWYLEGAISYTHWASNKHRDSVYFSSGTARLDAGYRF